MDRSETRDAPARRRIRAWHAAAAAPSSAPHPALAAALLFTGGTPAEAARRLGRALRAERRLARQGDRRYDAGRHLALVAACAALGSSPGGKIPRASRREASLRSSARGIS